MISLFNPGLLPWLLAITVPLAIHLLTRRTRRQMDLPTVRFLKNALAQQSQVFRLRHLLLLLLRTLAVLALVTAFLKPNINSVLGASTADHAAVVLVLDSSASMGYSVGGVSSFSRARNEALKVLEQLQPGDETNVLFCGAQPQAVLAQTGDDLAGLERAVREAKVSEERAGPTAAINLAVEQLAKSKAKAKRLYLFSDFQRTNWADVKFEAVPSATKVVFVATAPDRRQNVGITALRLFPTTPHVGEPIAAECEVFNSGDGVRQIPVTLTLSNGSHTTHAVTLAPYASATTSFPLQFDTPTQIECTASIPTDNMPADDVRRLTIDLRRMPVVVLITDEDFDRPPGGAFFLTRALHPDQAGQAGFRVIPVKPNALNNPVLHSADAVIVCDAPQMPEVQYQALSRYLTGGGNLVWFLYGDRIAEQIGGMARLLPASEPMPLQIDRVQNLSGNGKGYVTLTEAHYDSPLLKVFKDPAAADLSRIRFKRICMTGEIDPRAETLLKFEDGTAAAVRSGEGSGNLLLINMSPDPAWSDLARQESFLPLLHEFLKGIATRDTGSREFIAGGAATATLVAGPEGHWTRITCSGPEGEVPVTADPVTGSVVIERAPRSGFYHLASDGKLAATVAVNVHADETDLRSIDPRELETGRLRQNSYLAGVAGGDVDVGDLNKGHPLWHYLLLTALLCLCAEQGVSRLASRVRK